jgi:hypothetical protein
MAKEVVEKAPKRKFELLGGLHHVGDKTFKAPAVVESDDDLVKIYGPEKFREAFAPVVSEPVKEPS